MSITIKHIPNILSKEGREEKLVEYNRKLTVWDYIKKAKFKSIPLKFRVILSGKRIDNFKTQPQNGEEIIITPTIDEPVTTFLMAVGGGTGFWYGVWGAVQVAAVAFAVYSAFATPRAPSFGSAYRPGGGIDDGSATYGFDGVQTVYDSGSTIADIYGTHKFGGVALNIFTRASGDKNYLNVLLGIGEGEIDSISDIKINDNPIANFDGVSTDERMGTNNQSIIPGYEKAHNLYTVDVNLTQSNPHTYTTLDDDVEEIDIKLTVSGLYQQDPDNGNIENWTVDYRVEYRLVGAPGFIDLGITSITGKSRTILRRVKSITGLSPGQYDVRVTRTSADSSLTPLKEGDLKWAQVDEIKLNDFIYPNTALLAIEALGSEQLSGAMPDFSFIVKGRKVNVPDIKYLGNPVDWEDYYWDSSAEIFKTLSGDNACTWDGVTYIDVWSANPVWCIKDLMLNTRYGLGGHITDTVIDDDLFLEMAKYCEEKVADGSGGFEKRFTLDLVLDSPTKALDALAQIAMTFRGMQFYSEGSIKLRIDKDDTAVQVFGMGNIIKDSFSQSWKSVTDAPNKIQVQFMDAEKDYENDIIEFRDQEALETNAPERLKTVRIFTTRISQAIREARYTLNIGQNIRRTVTWQAGIDAIVSQVGDVVAIAHDVPQWGYSGRIDPGSTTSIIKLSREVTIEAATSYKLLIRFNEDDTIEEQTVTNAPGTTDTITVAVPFSKTPIDYDVFSFGETNLVKKNFRLVSLKKTPKYNVECSGIEVNSAVYDDSAVVIPETNYSALNYSIPLVSNLNLTEREFTKSDGTFESAIDVWFDIPDQDYYVRRYARARILFSEDNVNWVSRGETYSGYFTIEGGVAVGKTYYVKVVSITDQNEESAISLSPDDSITIAGKTTPPADVTGFGYTWGFSLEVYWNAVTDKDLINYEIRDEDANFGTDDSHLIYRGLAINNVLIPATRTPGTYYIRAVNTSGIYSDASASITPTNAIPDTPTITQDTWFGFATLDWADDSEPDILYYEIYTSPTGAWGGEESLYSKVPGTSGEVQGKAPEDAVAASPDATSITDATLIGKGADYFVGDRILQTTGTYKDQEATVTAFDNTTGKVSVASWPSGTPDALDRFAIKDRVHVKVRGVDRYGPGTFSTEVVIDIAGLSENMLGDEVITARKVTTGELITLTAQIKDAIITSAKIDSLTASKITTGSLVGQILTGGTIRTAASGARTVLDADDLICYDSSGGVVFRVKLSGVDVGDVIIGDYAGGNGILWDKSLSLFDVRGRINADDITVGTIPVARLGSGSISQDKLKTSMGEVSTSVVNRNLTLPGGQYGYYPQIKCDPEIDGGVWTIGGLYNSRVTPGAVYKTNISIVDCVTSETGYAQQRYITASGCDHWIFLLMVIKDFIDIKSDGEECLVKRGQMASSYQAPDHPCYGQGGNEIEIPQPFGNYDTDRYELVAIDNSILMELRTKITRRNTLLTIINKEYIIDDTKRPTYEPREIVEIDEFGDLAGESLGIYKTPDWARTAIKNDIFELKRRMVETLPDNILYKKMILK